MARPAKNLSGQVFGRLVVGGRVGTHSNNSPIWECACQCGGITTATSHALTWRQKRSCGCLRDEERKRVCALLGAQQISDLAGQRFGRLVVQDGPPLRSGERVAWRCRCECGAELSVLASNLSRGHTQSCGCLHLDILRGRRGETRDSTALDLAGQRFGRLEALCRVPGRSVNRARLWACSCDCGVHKVIAGSLLVQGFVVSCGCATKGQGRAVLRRASVRARSRFNQLRGGGGSFTAQEVVALFGKQKAKCAEPTCRASLKGGFHRDHIMPRVRGGTNDIKNIQLLCQPCNQSKHAKHPITWAQQNGRLL